ncbi:beta-galactosidase family protein [Dorcoceras hygrometricum]|uniref:Beta-galactosidase family protein n=1 Tax=Dorcoceras hygrometricum TaxID=472368 RepID=A0A2Z7AX29_9LAMI|nr:beta-galactosidase family protein [Dorcoceras hygrometricum]
MLHRRIARPARNQRPTCAAAHHHVGQQVPRAARHCSNGQPTSSLLRHKRAASCAPPLDIRAINVAPTAGQHVANGHSVVREVSTSFGAIPCIICAEEKQRRPVVARSSRVGACAQTHAEGRRHARRRRDIFFKILFDFRSEI